MYWSASGRRAAQVMRTVRPHMTGRRQAQIAFALGEVDCLPSTVDGLPTKVVPMYEALRLDALGS